MAEKKKIETGVLKSADVPWNDRKVKVLKALQKLKAYNFNRAVTVAQVRKIDPSLTPRDVRHYCYHAVNSGYTCVVNKEDVRGYCFHLNKKGKAENFDQFIENDS